MSNNLERMVAGEWYSAFDPALERLRNAARLACFHHASRRPDERGAMSQTLRTLFAEVGKDCFLESPFHCAYGMNIHLGGNVYINANCVILDTAPVTIGDGTMLGPGVQIYCADHHRDPVQRRLGMERALPVRIGADVWIGGSAILLPGVSVGDGAIVGAGAVVTRSVEAGARVVGNPARAL